MFIYIAILFIFGDKLKTHVRELKNNKLVVVQNKKTQLGLLISCIFLLTAMLSMMFGIVDKQIYGYGADHVIFWIGGLLFVIFYGYDMYNVYVCAKRKSKKKVSK